MSGLGRMKRQVLALGLAAIVMGCDGGDQIDLIVFNGNVLTVDSEMPTARAFAIRDGLFVQVGDDEEIRALAGPDTDLLDARGRTIIPGFNDAHLHAALLPPTAVDVSDATSHEDLVHLLRERAENTPDGDWVIGIGYDDTAIGGHLDRATLDTVSTGHPVFVFHASLHLSAVNSRALETANINAETDDPNGGAFFRDEDGQPTGLVSERPAVEMLFVDGQESFLITDLSSATAGLTQFFEKALSYGITSYSDALVPAELGAAYWWTGPEQYGVRVNLIWDQEDLDTADWLTSIDGALSWIGLGSFDGNWLKANSVKLFHGHSLSGRTARLIDPYVDRPDYYGEEPQRSQEELDAVIADIHNRGFQAAVHANGDFEIEMVLTALERAVAAAPREHRHRLEHASITNASILERARVLNLVVAPHSYIYEKALMIEPYGETRWPHMFANASLFELGIPNAANSDYPVSGLNPFLRIQSLLTRTGKNGRTYGPSQRLTVDQALYAYTMGGAIATFEEDVKGSITAGKFADFVILSDDPHSVPPLNVSGITVEATFSGGQLRYERASQ